MNLITTKTYSFRQTTDKWTDVLREDKEVTVGRLV